MNTMFLSEDYAEFEVPSVSMSEASDMLLASALHMGNLVEATLQADYITSKRIENLSEEVALQEKENFFKRVASAVKQAAIKARDAVSSFIRAVADKIKAKWTSLTAGRSTLKIPKGGAAAISTLLDTVGKLDAAARSGEADAKKYKANFDKVEKTVNVNADKAMKAVSSAKASKSWDEVQVNSLSAIQNSANKMAALAGSARTELDKQVKAAEAAEKVADKGAVKADAAAAKDGSKENKAASKEAGGELKKAQNAVALARVHVQAYHTVASSAGALSTLIGSVVGSATAKA